MGVRLWHQNKNCHLSGSFQMNQDPKKHAKFDRMLKFFLFSSIIVVLCTMNFSRKVLVVISLLRRQHEAIRGERPDL